MKLDEDARPFVVMLFAGHPKNEDEWRLLLAAYHRGDPNSIQAGQLMAP